MSELFPVIQHKREWIGFGRSASSRPILVTQSWDDFKRGGSDPRLSKTKIRKFLFAHGMRGPALAAEADRIVRGYFNHLTERVDAVAGEVATRMLMPGTIFYPYLWPKNIMTRHMKRMMHYKGRVHRLVIIDEYHRIR